MAFPLLGIAAGIGGSLLSGFGAKSREKKQKDMLMAMYNNMIDEARSAASQPMGVETDVNLSAMRRAAEAAGFNPVSALRAGLGSAFSRTVTYGHNAALIPTLMAQYLSSGNTPKVERSSMEVMGDAVSTGASLYTDAFNKEMDANLQMQMQQAYLGGLAKAGGLSGGSSARMFSVPSIVRAGSVIKSLGGGSRVGQSGNVISPSGEFKPIGPNGPVLVGPEGVGPTINAPFIGPVTLTNRTKGGDVEDIVGDSEMVNTAYIMSWLAESLGIQERLSFGNVHRATVAGVRNAAGAALNDAAMAITQWGVPVFGGRSSSQRAADGTMTGQRGGWTIGPGGMFVPAR